MTNSINREILRLAIPNILSNVSVPLLSSVDTALMGDKAAYLAAVGLASMLFNFLYWGFGFLRMGTTGMTAQAFGKGDTGGMANIFGQGMLVAMGVALLFLLFQIPLEAAGMWLLAADADTAPLMSEYFRIRIWAAPASLGLMVLMGWFFGMQNAIYPLILTLIINVFNIAISVLLVQYYNLGIAGVAYGTVIAQYLGLAAAVFLFLYKYKNIAKILRLSPVLKTTDFTAFFRINRDIFIRTLCLIAAFGFFYNRSSLMGVTLLAINQVFMQYVNWMSYGVDGFAFASESLVGKYHGANQPDTTRAAIRASFVWGGGFALLYALIFFLGNEYLLHIFTQDPDVLREGPSYLFWIMLYPLLAFASYIWDGIFVGFTAGRAMRDTMFLSLLAFIVAYYALSSFGNHGLWAAMLVYVSARGVLQWIWYRRGWMS